MSDTYDSVYARWLNNPENFWAEAAEAVRWHRKELPPGQIGSLVVKLPLLPGCLPTLWNND